MQILGLHNSKGKFIPFPDPVDVTETDGKLVDKDLYQRAVKIGDEWCSAELLKHGIESKLKVVV